LLMASSGSRGFVASLLTSEPVTFWVLFEVCTEITKVLTGTSVYDAAWKR
jgi:hypothetical protein